MDERKKINRKIWCAVLVCSFTFVSVFVMILRIDLECISQYILFIDTLVFNSKIAENYMNWYI